jgi:hypothetical protein
MVLLQATIKYYWLSIPPDIGTVYSSTDDALLPIAGHVLWSLSVAVLERAIGAFLYEQVPHPAVALSTVQGRVAFPAHRIHIRTVRQQRL